MSKGALSHLAQSGAVLSVRVTPRARRNAVVEEDGTLKVQTTAAPEDGKANKAVIKLVAHALGVAKTRLSLERGASGRDKLFRLD